MNDFEKQLRQESESLRIGPDTATWNRLNQRLERQRRGGRIRRLRVFAAAACMALLVVGTIGMGRWITTPSSSADYVLPSAELEAVDFSGNNHVVEQVRARVRSRASTVRVEEGSIDSRFVVNRER